LNISFLKTDLFFEISPNPLDTEILNGKLVYQDGKHDAVIAIGGGSGMDGGKAISLIANNNYSLWDFDNDKSEIKDIKKFPPLICIPTTSGTGAETSSTAMVTNTDLGMKLCVWHPNQKPIAAILDPELTLDLPKHLTAWTGVDALVHAIEAYSINSLYSVADAMAVEALTLIGRNLRTVVKCPHNLGARGGMLIGSCLAGISFQKGLGLVHAISHMIGAIYNSQHGLTNAILLPPVLKFNQNTINHKVEVMNYATFTKTEGFDNFYSNICSLLDDLEIDRGLNSLGVDAHKVSEISLKASKDAAASTNPRRASIPQLETLISESLSNAR
jgi:alcohol dehydrogenase class IV